MTNTAKGGTDRGRRAPPPDSWSALLKRIKHWQAPELLGLLHDLHARMPETRAVMAARVFPDRLNLGALEPYRKRIRRAMRPGKWQMPNVAAAKRAIRDYRRASEDEVGALDLMLLYLEESLVVTREFGDMDGRFYGAMDATIGEIAEMFKHSDAERAAELRRLSMERVRAMARQADIGWGMGDAFGWLLGVVGGEEEVGR